jgi:hypothetical protein
MGIETKVMACANEIADQFTEGFCNDRMVEFFAGIIRKYIPEEPEPLSEDRLAQLYGVNLVNDVFIFARQVEKAHGIRSFNNE